MKVPDPLELALSQIVDLLKLIEDKKDQPLKKKKLPPDILAKLAGLEAAIDFLKKVNKKTLESAGIDSQQLKKQLITGSTEGSPRQERTLERAMKIRQELMAMKKEYDHKLKVAKAKEKTSKKGGAEKIRKKKFKRMGGDQKWKPI